MPTILNLKFKGNKSFVAFSNLNDTETLTRTWKVCTKVASYLEQGQRLENLSWRLWHLQNLMVDTDNAKSKREFKRLSKTMGDKLDKEKGRAIEELEAPDFRRSHNTDIIRQRAAEKERSREASQNAKPGTIKRYQFTFSVDQPTPAGNYPVKKPDLKPSPEFIKRPRLRPVHEDHADDLIADDEAKDRVPLKNRKSAASVLADAAASSRSSNSNVTIEHGQVTLRFPPLFSSDFGPSALLYPTPTLTTRMNFGEGLIPSMSNNDCFSVMRPTIELPLDELLNHVDAADSPQSWHQMDQILPESRQMDDALMYPPVEVAQPQQDVVMQSSPSITDNQNAAPITQTTSITPLPTTTVPVNTRGPFITGRRAGDEESSNDSEEDSDELSSARPFILKSHPTSALTTNPFPLTLSHLKDLPQTIAPSKVNSLFGPRSNTPTGRPTLTVRTQSTVPMARSGGPGATATSLNPAVLRHTPTSAGGINSAPGGVKAECSNCGATHTPLWRRGLNDELNCNACGLYCKLHKRPRPKSMRNTHGEGRTQTAPRQETVDVMVIAQCYNCHTTATPLWRKDDEGKTVCNACGLYYKLHGSARPISMKSDVIRKRSRHDARRMGNGAPDTPSASPGVSRRASPTRDASPTLAPDSTTHINYDAYNDDVDYRNTQSELLAALSAEHNQSNGYQMSYNQFPGPYHPDYMPQIVGNICSNAESQHFEVEEDPNPRATKRRRMSSASDSSSTSDPPSSAVSYNSTFSDGYSSGTSAATSISSMSSSSKSGEFPFSLSNSGPALRGSGNTFWHPPMLPPGDHSPHLFQAPILPPAEESPMDYLHTTILPADDDALFSAFLHPPMSLPEQGNAEALNPPMHAPMFADFGNHDSYDTSMRVY